MCYVTTQCLAGTAQLYPQVAMKYVKLAQLKLMHATSGLTLFVLVTISLVLGMYSNYFVHEVTGTSWYACVLCPLIMLLIVTNQIRANYLPQLGVK
jgi:cytochrome b-561 domain-containing protein 2